jgi:hypothetical protein
MVYFSLQVLTTLGLGDYAPIPIWLRLIATFEALIGFDLLTASISSIVLLHLALGRVRTLSRLRLASSSVFAPAKPQEPLGNAT